jgi:hypothetical protein
VHLLEKNAKRRASLTARATQQGSQLVYYSPAVTEIELLFSIDLSVDRDLHDEVGDALAKAVTAAGALPVFAPAAPYLVAAGIAIPIAMKAMHLLARPNAFYAANVELNMERPGIELAQPGALVLYPEGHESSLGGQYKLGEGNVIRHVKTNKPYDGELPYVVISLDGTEHAELEKWSATAASGAILERFFSSGEVISSALGIVTDSLKLYNDMHYQEQAADALAKSKAATSAKEKKKYQDEYKAYLKNIQTKAIQDTVGKTS